MYRPCLLLPVLTIFLGGGTNTRGDDTGSRKALLIGVTAYPNLGKQFQLQGGGNDVGVIARVLRQKFDFRDEDITILSEDHGRNDENKIPNRKSIELAFARLAKGVRKADQVVVFLAGHGTELPTLSGPAGHFLPRDVAPWKSAGETGTVPNAIAGTEIGAWLRPIAEKQAHLWVIVDACFTGRMLRGGSGTVRQIPTDPEIIGGLQVPRVAMREDTKRGTLLAKSPIPLPGHEGVTCLYACSADEVTLEERVVTSDPDSPVLGLLTRALGDVLLNAASEMSYRELHGRIRKFYAATGRTTPTPVIEGAAINRAVLQCKLVNRKSFIVGESEAGDLTVDAGLLHGLTAGSILSVYPPPGEGISLRGYVRLNRVGSVLSECVPYAEVVGNLASKASLMGGRAEVLRIDYSANLLPVMIASVDSEGRDISAEVIASARKILVKLSAEKSATFRLTDSPAEARVLITCKDNEVSLLSSRFTAASTEASGRSFGSHKIDTELHIWLQGKLEQVARAHALLRLHAESGRDSIVKLSTNLIKLDSETSTTGTSIAGAVKFIRPGDVVAYEIKNQGDAPVDVTILYLDANLEIDAYFPGRLEPNRILPGKSLPLHAFRVSNKTLGSEFAVIIAVNNTDKEFLELTALAPSRRSVTASVKQLETPLGRLLDQSLSGREQKRSASQSLIRSYAVDLVPIEIVP